MKLPHLPLIEAFLTIYRERNMTLAAQMLNLSKAALTKRLILLEQEMGQLLFRRSTRKIHPTPEGEAFYNNALPLFDAVKHFQHRLKGDDVMKGVIRLTASSCAIQKFLSPLLISFQKNHPAVDLDVIVTDSTLDMIEHNLDISVRIGSPTSASVYGKRIAVNETILCATPDYIQQHGCPATLDDLKHHRLACIPFHQNAKFSVSKTPLKSFYNQQAIRTNDPDFIVNIALEHQAILLHSKWFILQALKNKQLVPLLTHDPVDPCGDIWLLSSVGPLKQKRVEVLYDHIYKEAKSWFNILTD